MAQFGRAIAGGGGGLHFRSPPDEFSGATIAAARTARDTYFSNASNVSALREFQGDQSLAIILMVTGSTTNVFETYVGSSGDAYDSTQWIERTDAVQGGEGARGAQGRFRISQYRNALTRPSTPTGGSYNIDTTVVTPTINWSAVAVAPLSTSDDRVWESRAPIDPKSQSGTVTPVWELPLEVNTLDIRPGHLVPDGGTTGQVLKKDSDTDLDVSWQDDTDTGEDNVQADWDEADTTDDAHILNKPTDQLIPAGGTIGQVVKKDSSTDYDVSWADDTDTGEDNVQPDWNEADTTSDAHILNKPTDQLVPAGGTIGQVLKKDTATDYDADWADETTGTPYKTGTAFPASPAANELFEFNADATGIMAKDFDGVADLTEANRGDVFKYDGTDWVKQSEDERGTPYQTGTAFPTDPTDEDVFEFNDSASSITAKDYDGTTDL